MFNFENSIQHQQVRSYFPPITKKNNSFNMNQQSTCHSFSSSTTLDANSFSFGSDGMSFFKRKLNNDQSINFVESQQFKLRSFNNKKCTNLKTDEKNDEHCLPKTKQIKKNDKFQKFQNKIVNRQNLNTNNYYKQITRQIFISNKNVDYKQPKKQYIPLPNVFDWMMELASLMKITKSCFYRAVSILDSTQKISNHVLQKNVVQKYVCACLLISAKFDDSNIRYLDVVYLTNNRKISKEQITKAQVQIYQILKWKIPTISLISEQIQQILKKWNNFLKNYEYPFMKQQILKKLVVNYQFGQFQNSLQNTETKLYGQILYLIDVIILNQTRRYLSQKQNFRLPIIIALYACLTISIGDHHNKNQNVLPLLNAFCRNQLGMDDQTTERMNKQIKYNFFKIDFANSLSKIPLMMNWSKIIQNECQFYLPITNGL